MMRVGIPIMLKRQVAAKLTEGLLMPGIWGGEQISSWLTNDPGKEYLAHGIKEINPAGKIWNGGLKRNCRNEYDAIESAGFHQERNCFRHGDPDHWRTLAPFRRGSGSQSASPMERLQSP